jgi:hypothetical protein
MADTKCLSQVVYFMTIAKPILEQTDMISPALVMLLAKPSSAIIGFIAIMAISRPAPTRTMRDSYRFSSNAMTAKITTIPIAMNIIKDPSPSGICRQNVLQMRLKCSFTRITF